MPRRQGRHTTGRDRGRSSDPSDYYVATDSDAKYRQKVRQRVRDRVVRKWIIRVFVVAALVVAGYLWGPRLVTAARVKGQMTGHEYERVGGNIREGADRRGGSEWVEGSP
jgi:hypothetical protein